MKPLRLKAAIIALWPVLVFLAGCSEKKPVLVKPQQAPPAAAPQPTPTPEAAQPPEQQAEAQASPTPTPEAAKPEASENEPARKPKKPSPAIRGQRPATEARNKAPKISVPPETAESAPPTGEVAPGPMSSDGAKGQISTEQLLQNAENNLNAIKRQLSKDEEAMRAQVKEFIAQSRRATGENDPARAHNLAQKARTLSDELVKQR